MIRGEFEKDLEKYLAHKRKKKWVFPNIFQKLKPKKKMTETQLPPEVQKYEEGTPAEPLELPEEGPSKGFFTNILEKIGIVSVEKKEDSVPAEEVQQMLAKDDLNQDMKEIAKIALTAIKQLPPEQMAQFKSSPEFARLKELLKKHQLIK